MSSSSDRIEGNQVPSIYPELFGSGHSLNLDEIVGFTKAKEMLKDRFSPHKIFISNVDSFNGSHILNSFTKDKLLSRERLQEPRGSYVDENDFAFLYDRESESSGEINSKSFADKNFPSMNALLSDIDPPFWTPEDELYGEFDIGSLSLQKYTALLDLETEEERLQFLQQNAKRFNSAEKFLEISEKVLDSIEKLLDSSEKKKNSVIPVKEEEIKYSFLISKRNSERKLPTENVKILSCSQESSEWSEELVKCAVIIYDISSDINQISECRTSLNAILKHLDSMFETNPGSFFSIKEERRFILISTFMTWAETEFEDGEERSEITEKDVNIKKGHPKYAPHFLLEEEVIAAGQKYPNKLKTAVIVSGIPYGYEEDKLNYLFRTAWMHLGPLPIIEGGFNTIPLIHIQDLARIVFLTSTIPFQSSKYIFAVEPAYSQQEKIVKGISEIIGTTTVMNVFQNEEVPSYVEIDEEMLEIMKVDIKLKPQVLTETFSMDWKYGLNLVTNLPVIIKEYIDARSLQPMKICIFGPPCVGKTLISNQLSSLYGLECLTQESAIIKKLEELEKLQNNLEMELEHFRQRRFSKRVTGFLVEEFSNSLSNEIEIDDLHKKSQSFIRTSFVLPNETPITEDETQNNVEDTIPINADKNDTNITTENGTNITTENVTDIENVEVIDGEGTEDNEDDILSDIKSDENPSGEKNLENDETADVVIDKSEDNFRIREKEIITQINEVKVEIEKFIQGMEKGVLSDETIIRCVKDAASERTFKKFGYILDGFPRTYKQFTTLFNIPQSTEPIKEAQINGNLVDNSLLPDLFVYLEGSFDHVTELFAREKESESFSESETDFKQRLEEFRLLGENNEIIKMFNFFFESNVACEKYEVQSDESPNLEDTVMKIVKILGPPRTYVEPESFAIMIDHYNSKFKVSTSIMEEQILRKYKCIEEFEGLAENWVSFIGKYREEYVEMKEVEAMSQRAYFSRFLFKHLRNAVLAAKCDGTSDVLGYIADYLFNQVHHIKEVGDLPETSDETLKKMKWGKKMMKFIKTDHRVLESVELMLQNCTNEEENETNQEILESIDSLHSKN